MLAFSKFGPLDVHLEDRALAPQSARSWAKTTPSPFVFLRILNCLVGRANGRAPMA